MKKIYSLFFIGTFILSSVIVKSQTIMWTDTFINGVASNAAQVTTWDNFRAQLDTNLCFTKMTIKGTYDTVGQVCTDPTIIKAYANALKNFVSYTSPLTNGNVWSLCARYSGEVWLNPPSQCSGSNCPTGYIIRPGILNTNWGGVNTATCSPPSQRQYFIFEFGSSSTINATACDSYVSPSGNYTWTSSGSYKDTLVSAANCDSIITVNLTINTSPTVILNTFTNDTICIQSSPIALPIGTPSGGTYSGAGVSGSNFDPSIAGVGSHYIVYNYTDNNNCSNSDSTLITVAGCVGINEFENHNISIYPNPTNGLFTIDMGSYDEAVNYTVTSIDGRVVTQKSNVTDNKITIDLGNESKGVYLLKLHNHKSSSVFRVTKL
jgi:hypothetical protein